MNHMIPEYKLFKAVISIKAGAVAIGSAFAGLLGEAAIGETSPIQIGLVVILLGALGAFGMFLAKLLFKAGQEFSNIKNEIRAVKDEIATVHERGTRILAIMDRLESEHEARCQNYKPKLIP